jgi:hypothetical protein
MNVYKTAGDDLKDITEKPVDENGKEVKDDAKKVPGLEAQAKKLFEEAEDMAAGDAKLSQAVTALVKAANNRNYTRGAFGGPRKMNRALNPGQSHEYHIPFISGESATVGLTSEGSTLRLTINNPGGAEIFAVNGNYANYNWTPRGGATKTFTVVVKNVGRQGSVYTLFTN